MADLVDKINEMIDILQEIDPAAAASFRGETKDQRVKFIEPKKVVQTVLPVQPAKVRKVENAEKMAGLFELKRENLIEAIVFSEIIGKPVSTRYQKGRK